MLEASSWAASVSAASASAVSARVASALGVSVRVMSVLGGLVRAGSAAVVSAKIADASACGLGGYSGKYLRRKFTPIVFTKTIERISVSAVLGSISVGPSIVRSASTSSRGHREDTVEQIVASHETRLA